MCVCMFDKRYVCRFTARTEYQKSSLPPECSLVNEAHFSLHRLVHIPSLVKSVLNIPVWTKEIKRAPRNAIVVWVGNISGRGVVGMVEYW